MKFNFTTYHVVRIFRVHPKNPLGLKAWAPSVMILVMGEFSRSCGWYLGEWTLAFQGDCRLLSLLLAQGVVVLYTAQHSPCGPFSLWLGSVGTVALSHYNGELGAFFPRASL